MESAISIITSLIGCITLIVKTFFGKSQKREAAYYEKILKPYVLKLNKGKKISAVSVVSGLAKRNDDDIPKYIFYMLDNAKEEELRCVLLSDYMDLYPNEVNGIGKVLDIVYKVINYILVAVSFISLFYGIMYVMNGLLESISFFSLLVQRETMEGSMQAKIEIIRNSLVTGTILGLFSILSLKLSIVSNDDRYEIKRNKIEKMIRNKVRRYNRKNEKVVL